MPTSDVQIELFGTVSGDWRRRYLPPVHAANFELLDLGGMGAGSIELEVPWETLDLDGNEFVDIYLFGRLIYRGWVRTATRAVASPESASPSLQSAVDILNHAQVRWKYAYGGDGADLATIAGDLISDFVTLLGRFGSFVTTDLDPTDILLKEFDATGRSVAQAMNMLCEYANGAAIWGMEAAWDLSAPPLPVHRIYFRPKSTTTGKFYTIGGNVTGFGYPKDTGSIINVVNLVGGVVEQPNLCFNGSFEDVAPAGETVGNLLLDHSFEDNDAAWTLTGSRKFTGMDGTARGSPKAGKHWLELDQNTESGIQVVLASYTVQYDAWCWIRRESAANATEVKLTIEGLDSGNNVIVSSATAFTPPVGTNWEKLQVTRLDTTGQPTVTKIRYRVETNGGTASNDGVLVDACALVVADSEGAVGWRRRVAGAANASTFQWNYRDTTPFHKGYAVRSLPSGIAGASDYVEIRTTKDKRIEVPPNERLSLVIHTKGNSADFTFGLTEFTSDGTETTTSESATETGGAGSWLQSTILEVTGSSDGPGITTRADTAYVEVFVRHRENAEVLIDGIFLCTGSIPLEVRDTAEGDYWAGEVYERRFKTSDALFTGGLALSAAADSSITDYGDRETDESQALVIDYESATEWAQDYFNVRAVPSYMARLDVGNLKDSTELLVTTDDRVQVHNLNDAPEALNPVRVSYTIRGDVIAMNADLGSKLPTFEELLRIAQGRERGRAF